MGTIGKVLLAVFGASVVIILIAVPTAVYLSGNNETNAKRTFTLDDVYNSSLSPRSYSLTWISDDEYLYPDDGTIMHHDLKKGTSSVFLNNSLFQETSAFDYKLSADRKYVAFVSNYEKLWRHSFTATYTIFDLKLLQFVKTDMPSQIQYFEWAPEGNKLAYVWKNNVYVKASPALPLQQVTSNGKDNEILNGIPDWVYEEEMFSSTKGFWWSPGGKHLAYAEFNDTGVPTIEYSWYGEGQYPRTIIIPYPKPGTQNPTVKLFVVDTANVKKITQVVVPPSIGSGDHYLATVTWVTDERIAVQWLKRIQNHLLLQICDFDGTTNWTSVENLEVKSSTGWVGRFAPPRPVFKPDTHSYYLVKSDSKGYKHIHHCQRGTATPVTSGEWEVFDILKVTTDAIYFTSNQDGNRPGGKNLYKHSDKGTVCLTCGVREGCQYNTVRLSHSASYYQMMCFGPGIPFHSLWDNKQNKELKILEDNSEFAKIIADIQMPTMRRDKIKIEGFDLWYQMYLPPGFDESKKYPLLIDVYAGPCSQKANFIYDISWSTYLASTEKVIVASFDGRGSGYQGDKIMHAIYRRLGTYEVEDQITAVKEFIKMGFIDEKRVAIWGWSYGGYVSSMALGAGSGVFKCGMAVAPVSKWDYYDSIYTERYMELPSGNSMYENTTVMERVKNFHSVQYLLIHGTADDNVHFQQGAQISKALVDDDVDFEAMWYTDKDHALSGHAHHHVYTLMSHFLQRCFG